MKNIAALLILLLTAAILHAQNSSAILYAITEKDGLTDNVANCFFQDSRGVMWIGTNYGLNSFDGSVIKSYHSGKNNNSIAHDAINDIKEDANQTLWIATGNGLSTHQLNSNNFSTFLYDSVSPGLNRYYSIALLDNTVFVGTEEGLLEFDRSTKKFTLYKIEKQYANHIIKIFIDSKQQIWLGTFEGLWSFNNKTKKFTCYDSRENDMAYDELVTDVFEDHNQQLWFSTWNKGLKKLAVANKTITNFLSYAGSNGNATSLAEQKNNDGTFSLWQAGTLCQPNFATTSFTYLHNNNKPISCNHIYCDKQNLLWISTNEGIKIYNPAKQYFQTTLLSSYVPLTSQGIGLYTLQGKFLLGGEGGTSLMLFSDSVKLIKNLSSKLNNGAAVMSFQQDAKGDFWLSTSNGLFIFDSLFNKKDFFIHKDNDYSSLPKNFMNYTFTRRNGETWLLPWRKGLWKIDNAAKKFYRVTNNAGDTLLPSNNLSKAVEDKNGNIWIIDFSAGLFKYDYKTGVTKNIITERRFSNEYIINDKLWTVSAGEIFCTDIHTDKVEIFLLPQGKNKYEYDFVPDNNGWLWIATKTGLLAFNTQTKSFKSFTEDDGLFSNDLNVTFALLSNGNILMASGNYAVTFSPTIVQQNTASATLLFTHAIAEGKEKNLTGNILEFNWNEKNIQLNWALLNYSNPLSNIYYYKLDGIDNNWQNAGSKGQVIYNSLEPGTYTFHFKASTSDAIMSEEKTIRLIIHPPFWKTWWFILLAFAIAASIFYAIVKSISQRKLKEKLLHLEKEQAIEKERNRISRDMHDDLGSGLTKIAILTEVIKTQPSSTQNNIDKISATARNLVDNLDEMVWALNPKNDSLDKLIAYIAEYTNQYLESTTIIPIIDLPEQITSIYISEEKRRNIFMSVKEFLNNSVKHSNAKTIWLQLLQQQNSFQIILKDDGKGIDKNLLTGLGNGLKNMQQRIEDIGGKATIASSEKGTSFTIDCAI